MTSSALGARDRRVLAAGYRALSSTTDVGGATVLANPAAPGSPMLNRVVGLGVERAATEADVDAALAAIDAGVTYYVAVDLEARPPELSGWLSARGLEPSWGWMAFRRGTEDPPVTSTSLRLTEVTGGDAADVFARIVRESYGLPQGVEPVLARAPETGWRCWVALDGDEPAAAAALFTAEGAGYLGLAATLPEHRGKGAQNALLAARVRAAREQGCEVVLTETGERRGDRPSNSYRNIVRAGFEEVVVTANWVGHKR